MVAFAVGGLLGDTLFHLLPEIFLGEDAPEHVRFGACGAEQGFAAWSRDYGWVCDICGYG